MSENKNPKEKKNGRERKEPKTFNPEIKRSLGVILLFIIAGLLILSYFGVAGVAGTWVNRGLGLIFGQIRIAVPFLLIFLGVVIELQRDYPHDSRHYVGLVLLLIGLDSLIQLFYPLTESWFIAKQGLGGGLLGWAGSYPPYALFGFWASLIILSGIFLISLLLLLNTSLASILQTQKNFFKKLGIMGKIITGVITLFIKKEPRVSGYPYEDDPSAGGPPPEFQAQNIKPKIAEKSVLEKAPKAETNELPPLPPRHDARKLPPLSLLTTVKTSPSAGDIKANMYTIQKTLHNFGIEVEMGEVHVGPTVSQYCLKPADGVKLARITGLNNDLAMALAAHPLRIEAPIPGKSLVGIEVPNLKVAMVTLRELLESKEHREMRGALTFALGKDVAGTPYFADLTHLPHLLIAGATGSGKTVCLNTVIMSLLFQHTSETLRFILVDPKRVELQMYNGLPHLLTPVITDTQKTVNALKWTIGEMDRRFDVLSKASKRNIGDYNRIMEEKMPYIIFVVDELADLMTTAGAEIEGGIIRLAQMARAVGIHLILATQRPSVDVITGLIKANIPGRIAFSVASIMDSRTILDMSGAEKLLGRGDMLWSPPSLSKPKRLQDSYISEEEIRKVVDFLKDDAVPEYNDDVVSKRQQTSLVFNGSGVSDDDDPLLQEAMDTLVQAGKGSASLLQRRLKVGYARAARILDLLEAKGIIGPADGAKPREILVKGSAFSLAASVPIPNDQTETPTETEEFISTEETTKKTEEKMVEEPVEDEETVEETEEEEEVDEDGVYKGIPFEPEDK